MSRCVSLSFELKGFGAIGTKLASSLALLVVLISVDNMVKKIPGIILI